MRFTLAGLAGTLGAFIAGTIIAIIMQPWIAPQFGEHIRTEQDGLLFPALIMGYVTIGFVLAYIAPKWSIEKMSISQVAVTGLAIGLAIFLGDHLITAGWSRLPAGPMAISGFLDSFSVVFGLLAVYFVYRYKRVS